MIDNIISSNSVKKVNAFLAIIIFLSLFATILTHRTNSQTWYDPYLDESGVLGQNTSDNESFEENSLSIDAGSLRRNHYSMLSDLRNLTSQERNEMISELNELPTSERCEKIRTNIQLRSDYYQNGFTTHLIRYQQVVIKLNSLFGKLADEGLNTNELRSQRVKLDQEIQLFNSDMDKLTQSLMNAKESVCVNGENYTNHINTSRENVNQVRERSRDIKSYISSVLINELRKTHSNLPENN